MVANFCAGGAAINVLARHVGAEVVVVDVGVATPIPTDSDALVRRNVALGTRNLAVEPAMTDDEVGSRPRRRAGRGRRAVAGGARMLVTGDMGIGNTTLGRGADRGVHGATAPQEVTGRGTGIDDAMLARKKAVIARALARRPAGAEPLVVLAELGGLEIAALCGFVVGAASRRVPVIVDGVIAAAAALVATVVRPRRRRVPDLRAPLERDRDRRSSSRSSASSRSSTSACAWVRGRVRCWPCPTVQAAAKILREMATFDSAGVSDKADASELRGASSSPARRRVPARARW